MKRKSIFLILALSLMMTACSNSNLQEDNVEQLVVEEISEERIEKESEELESEELESEEIESEEIQETTTDAIVESDTALEPTILNESDISNLNDLNMLSSLENMAVCVKLLSNVELDDNGIPMFDDSNEFAVVASVGDKNFVLMDRQMVQLGAPKVSLYENMDGQTVIVLTDIRTAKYDIYEYTYDESLGGFVVKCLTQNDGINFIGEIFVTSYT